MNVVTPIETVLLLSLGIGTVTAEVRTQGPTVRDSGGVVIVTNTNSGAWGGRERWVMQEDLRIGVVDGDPRYQFGSISGVGVGVDGSIYVRDGLEHSISVFHPDGRYRTSFGRYGFGPGEIAGPGPVVLGPGDTVFVPDPRNVRINRYHLEHTDLSSIPITVEEGQGVPRAYSVSQTGTVYAQLTPYRGYRGRYAQGGMDAIAVMQTNGTFTDTVATFPSRKHRFVPGGPIFSPLLRFGEGPVWTVFGEDRVVVAATAEYRLNVYSRYGLLERVVTKLHVSERFRAADRVIVERFYEEQITRAQGGFSGVATILSVLNIPDWYPALVDIAVGPAQSLWVQRFQRPSELSLEQQTAYDPHRDYGSPQWDVFDSTGVFLGVVTMPRGFVPHVFKDDAVYGVSRDDADVEYLVRLRIKPGR